MNYTLKMTCATWGGWPRVLLDESTMFVPADRVMVCAKIEGPDLEAEKNRLVELWTTSGDEVRDLSSNDNFDVEGHRGREMWPSRLVLVYDGDQQFWFITSRAWLLGADGRTIERIAP